MDRGDLMGKFSRINISQVILTSLLLMMHAQLELYSILLDLLSGKMYMETLYCLGY